MMLPCKERVMWLLSERGTQKQLVVKLMAPILLKFRDSHRSLPVETAILCSPFSAYHRRSLKREKGPKATHTRLKNYLPNNYNFSVLLAAD